jgi:hypothetical protein
VAAAIFCATTASAPARSWVMSGSLAGTYTSSVAWQDCSGPSSTGTAQESLRLSVRIAPGKPQPFTGSVALGGKMVGGGHWSASGAYEPRQEAPTGGLACGAQRSFQCGGSISREGAARAVFWFLPHGRSLAGEFRSVPSFHERAPNQDQPCSLDDAVAGPLFGLDSTDIEADALRVNSTSGKLQYFTVPRSRLARRKAFTITNTARPDGGCPRDEYSQCTESGSITLTLHFKPSR